MNDERSELRLRARRLNRARTQTRNAAYVLCWLQQALRASDNPVIDAAIAAGNKHNLPVVVYHGLGERYPHASRRLHRFILEASRSLGKGVSQRGLRFASYVERAEKPEPGLMYRLAERAALIVTDDIPAFVGRSQAERVACRVKVPLIAVDAACLIPMNCFPHPTDVTIFFRRAHAPLREQHINSTTERQPEHRVFDGDLCFASDAVESKDSHDIDELIASCRIDHTLPTAPHFDGSREAAIKQLARAVEHVLPRYDQSRNNPAAEFSVTRLSPYLHFGVLSAREIAQATLKANVPSRARYKFFDELLTWREFFHHTARHAADPTRYENIPLWARETLAAHAADKRSSLPTREQLVDGETGDETWDAAQRQYAGEGWMHNNLRMYWGKQLIKWHRTPEEARQTACYLNDRLSLDGRDASTYGNLQWCFGRFASPSSEAPIYGRVGRHGDAALRRRPGVEAWLAEQSKKIVPRISVNELSG